MSVLVRSNTIKRMAALTKHECLRCVYSVEKLFQHHSDRILEAIKPLNRAAFVDCRAFSEVNVIKAVIFELPKGVFQQNLPNAAIHRSVLLVMT